MERPSNAKRCVVTHIDELEREGGREMYHLYTRTTRNGK